MPLISPLMPYHRIKTCGRDAYFNPHCKRKGSAASPKFLGPPTYAITWFDLQRPNSAWGVFLRGQLRPHPKGRILTLPIFGILPNLYPDPLTWTDQIRRSDTYGEGRVSTGQPRHCICSSASRGLSAIEKLQWY